MDFLGQFIAVNYFPQIDIWLGYLCKRYCYNGWWRTNCLFWILAQVEWRSEGKFYFLFWWKIENFLDIWNFWVKIREERYWSENISLHIISKVFDIRNRVELFFSGSWIRVSKYWNKKDQLNVAFLKHPKLKIF
jgi:hypothetical protein